MRAGDAFHFCAIEPHLWFIISDPAKDAERVLLVNVTTWRKDKDQGCLLGPDDHPEIKHNSCIYFVGSRVHTDHYLSGLYNSNRIILHDPLKPSVLSRIREAAAASRTMRIDHGQILFDQELVEP